jgi:hypothetical protein
MKASKYLLGVLCASMLLLFAACGNAAITSEAEMQADVEIATNYDYYKNGEVIDNFEILERETDHEYGDDNAIVRVESHDDSASYIRLFDISYSFYEEHGWLCDNVVPVEEDKWASTPLAGVSEEAIKASLDGLRVKIGGDEWNISEDDIEDVTVGTRDTNLEGKSDTVAVTLSVTTEVLLATGELELEFNYDDGWEYEDYSVITPFESSYQQGKDPQLTNETLISDISKQKIIMGEQKHEQEISLSNDEISNFSIDQVESLNRGMQQTYSCSFVLAKELVSFDVMADIIYQYDPAGGWEPQYTNLMSNVKSVSLDGVWSGQYNASSWGNNAADYAELKIEIPKVESDGSVEAICSFSALPTNPSVPSGSFSAIGGIDYPSLRVTLEPQEWIERPEDYNLIGFMGYLRVEDSTLTNTVSAGNYTEFEVTKEN